MEHNSRTSKVKGPILILTVAIVLATVVGMAIIKFTSTPEFKFTTDTNPLKVKVTLAKETVLKDISSQGGAIQLKNGKDQEMALKLDKDSLLEPQPISVTPVDSIEGLDKEWKFISGAQLGPDGTRLATSGELTIELPSGLSKEKLVGFAYEADGRDFHFYPAKISGNSAVFQLSGFSGYGVLSVGGTSKTPPQPSTTEMQAKQYIASVVGERQRSVENWAGDLNDDQMRRIKNLLKGWHSASVKPRLAKAEKDDSDIDGAVLELLSWWQIVQVFGLQDDFEKEHDELLDSCAKAIINAVVKAKERCLQEKDPSQVSVMLRLYKLAKLTDIDGREGLSIKSIKEDALKCARFELKVKGKFKIYSPEVGTWAHTEGSGKIILAVSEDSNEDFTISGKGDIAATFTVALMGQTVGGNESYTLSVPPAKFDILAKDKKVSLLLDLHPEQIDEDEIWLSGLGFFHLDELVEGEKLPLSDWNILGKGDTFARKTFKNTKYEEGQACTEDSTFELVFTPGQ